MRFEVAPTANDAWNAGEFPVPLFRKFADLGIWERGIPETGSTSPAPTSMLNGFLGLEMMRVDASTGIGFNVHGHLAMDTIANLGSPEQRRRWLPAMAHGDSIGAFAMTEPHGARGLWSHRRRAVHTRQIVHHRPNA